MVTRLLILLLLHASKIDAKVTMFDKYSKGLALLDSSLAVYAGSSDVVAFTKLGQNEQEEAKETLLNTMLTLSIVDVNGGIVLPGMEGMVDFVKKSKRFAPFRQQLSDYSKALAEKAKLKMLGKNWFAAEKGQLKNQLMNGINSVEASDDVVGKQVIKSAARWFGKGGKLFLKALGPLTDILSIGLSSWNIKMAVEAGDTNKIISSSVALASGVIGLAGLVLAFVTGITVLGPLGVFVGALFGIAATLIELFGGSPTNEFQEKMAQLTEIKNASVQQLFPAIRFFNESKRPFNDVYVVNQAALLDFGIRYNSYVVLKEGSGYNQYSLVNRRRTDFSVKQSPEHPDIVNGTFLLQGFQRRLFISDYDYEQKKEIRKPLDYGFDFYGQNPNGPDYVGVRVLVETNLVSKADVLMKGVLIDTTVPSKYKQDDIVRLGDYENIKEKTNVTINTGPGNDAINIDGVFGKFDKAYENRMNVDLGSGLNTLNLGGIRRNETRFKHIILQLPSGQLFYVVNNEEKKFHSAGFIRGVSLFSGSPLNDIIVLQPLDATSHNDIVRRNVTDIFRAHFVVTESYGSNNYVVNLLNPEKAVHTKISIIDHSSNQSYITICDPMNAFTMKNLVYENRTLHIYKDLNTSPTLILMSISLRFSKESPKFRLVQSHAFSHLSVFPTPVEYHSLSSLNPVLFSGSRLHVDIDQDGEVIGTSRSDLAELKCPLKRNSRSYVKTLRLQDGVDFLLVNLQFIEQCVENQTPPKRFVLSRLHVSDLWDISIHDANEVPRGSHSLRLLSVDKIINEHGHELVDLRREPGRTVDLYERYVQETKKQFGCPAESEDEVMGDND